MNPREKGFLLLCCHLGDPGRRVLSPAQLRELSRRMALCQLPSEKRELCREDLAALGYGPDMAGRILALLSQEDVLEYYLHRARQQSCVPVSRVSADYPLILRKRLGTESPGCLWAKGDLSLLGAPGISLVGSRELNGENRLFSQAVGRMAAREGLVLISGNARGADREAQHACLEAGGRVICVVADALEKYPDDSRVLYLSEDAFDLPFSSQRALSRNRIIHALGAMVFVAQAKLGIGGSWDGAVKNLRHGWSSVACFRDGSEASAQLEQLGAFLVTEADLLDLTALMEPQLNLFHEMK